jgi:uncharacterized protein YbjQ (UPF0145 family)
MPDLERPPWDGKGLPPIAEQRLRRAAAAGVATSLLSAPAAVSLEGCGFSPVGEVMGCIVEHIGWRGYGCGAGPGSWSVGTVTSGTRNRWAGLTPYVDALYRGWETALSRMLVEAADLGADGVVGVRLTKARLGEGGNHEFVALGTAVRGHGPTRARRPFHTDLSGSDVAKLLHAGWVPTGIAVGIAAAVRHNDYRTYNQARMFAGNTEVTGYTDLVSRVRHDARTQFTRRAADLGGESATVSQMGLRVWANEPSENHVDHYAEATVIGTTATRFHRGEAAPTRSLSILPLRGTTREETRR